MFPILASLGTFGAVGLVASVLFLVALFLGAADGKSVTPKVPKLNADGTPRKAPVRKSAIERIRLAAERAAAEMRGIKRQFRKDLFRNVEGLAPVADAVESFERNAREIALYADPEHCTTLVNRLLARVARVEARHKVAVEAQKGTSLGATMALDVLSNIGDALYDSSLASADGVPDWKGIAARYLPPEAVSQILAAAETDVFAAFRRSKSEDTPTTDGTDSDIPADVLASDDSDSDDDDGSDS